MWCYIKTDDVEEYLNKYSELSNYWSSFGLLKTNDAIFLPRLFLENYPSDKLVKYHGKTDPIFHNINFEFKGKLRPEQKKATDIVLDIYNKKGYVNGIIKLPPGTGKTVLAVYLASKLGLKTCIVLNNSELFKQWILEIMKFSGCTEDDIGLIRQNTFVTDNKLFTVAMSATLASKLKRDVNSYFKKVNESGFGLVIYDEVHNTSSSDVYSKCSLFFRTKNIIGLSATPFHVDSAKILMENTIGKIIYESKNYELVPKYNIIQYNSGLVKYLKLINGLDDYIKKKAVYNKIILESNVYKDILIKLLKKVNSENRKTIVICMTKNQVMFVSNLLDELGIEHRRFYGGEREIDKLEDNLLVATYAFCGTGFDMNRLDCLILACPLSGKKSLIQVIGRILRKKDGKKEPIVYDLVDNCFPTLSIPEYRRKISIISGEFPACKIHEENY